MSEDALRAAADRLYGAPLSAFVRERTALVRAAREDGDRDLAARIGALAKPSTAAALVNDLVREQPDDVQRLLDLGADLRRAQEQADRAALQRLTAERRALLPQIVERAADRVAEDGHRPSPAVLEEAQQTLQAALGSDGAADAVRSGRLLRGLRADGLEDVDSARAVAAPGGLEPLPERTHRPVVDLDEQREAQERARDRARAEAETARRRATGLRQEAEAADDRAAAAEADAAAHDAEVTARREALREAEGAASDARGAADRARARAVAADAQAALAESHADEVQTALR